MIELKTKTEEISAKLEVVIPKKEKFWVVLPQPTEDEVSGLLDIKGLHPVAANLLLQRGVATEAALRAYFNPTLDDLHDPFLMKDMDKAVGRLLTAIQNEERIMIFGDYDVDGTTSVSLVYKYLLNHYKNLECYIPDRYQEDTEFPPKEST